MREDVSPMSTYVHIFARSKHDDFVELWCSAGSSAMMQVVGHWAPWEKIRRIDEPMMQRFQDDAAERMNELKEIITHHEKLISEVGSWNNPIDEKIDLINDYQRAIEDDRQDLDELRAVNYYLRFIRNMIEDGVEIYAGVECGSAVTVEDIEDSNK